jgi:hypothetical protein
MQYCLRTLLIALFLASLAATANGQPVFRTKHNWTVNFGAHSYGITEDVAYGDFRSTTIHLGPLYFSTKMTAFQVAGIGTAPLAMLLVTVAAITIFARKGDRRRSAGLD